VLAWLSNKGFWLPLWYLPITPLVSSDYLFGIFWLPLWYLLITSLVSSDYPFGIFWLPLWYLLITPLVSSDYLFGIFWLPLWYLLITPLLSSDYPFSIFWLPLWYLLITPLVSSDYPFGIFWLPLWYLPTFLAKTVKHSCSFRKVKRYRLKMSSNICLLRRLTRLYWHRSPVIYICRHMEMMFVSSYIDHLYLIIIVN
jgi:hypothetical protein